MLTPELKKLKKYLEGDLTEFDEDALLEELKSIDEANMKPLFESLSISSKNCPTCGKKI